MKIISVLAAVYFLAACTHSIHLVHTSGFSPYYPVETGTRITAKSKQDVILWFSKDTHYVEEAYNDLMKQCIHGEITGITTQFSTSHGFLSWTNKILMQGNCFKT